MWLEIKAIVVLNHGQNPTKAKIDKAMAHVCFVNSDTCFKHYPSFTNAYLYILLQLVKQLVYKLYIRIDPGLMVDKKTRQDRYILFSNTTRLN